MPEMNDVAKIAVISMIAVPSAIYFTKKAKAGNLDYFDFMKMTMVAGAVIKISEGKRI